MIIKKLIVAASLALAACVSLPSSAHADVIVEVAPIAAPVARVETIIVRPGYLWCNGHWYWNSAQWVWIPGHHIVVRRGYRWIHPHYTYVTRRWVYTRGHWVR